MGSIRVYRHKRYDCASREFVRQASYATEAAIMRDGGVVMYSTLQEVCEGDVDSRGEWSPRLAGWRMDGEPA